MDVAGEKGERSRDEPAPAQVIVVAADDHGFVGLRSGALEHSDHVLGRDRLPVDRELGRELTPFEVLRTRLQVVLDLVPAPPGRRPCRNQNTVGEPARSMAKGIFESVSVPPA